MSAFLFDASIQIHHQIRDLEVDIAVWSVHRDGHTGADPNLSARREPQQQATAASPERALGELIWKVRWAPPAWRDDFEWAPGLADICVINNSGSLIYLRNRQQLFTDRADLVGSGGSVAAQALMLTSLPTIQQRQAGIPLFRPNFSATEWVHDANVSEAEFLGRPVRDFRIWRRAGVDMHFGTPGSGYWPGVHEYRCIVDREFGLILELTGVIEEQKVAGFSTRMFRVNQGIPASTFDFSPPDGTEITYVGSERTGA